MPKQASSRGGRGGSRGKKNSKRAASPELSNPFESSPEPAARETGGSATTETSETDKSIPKELLTRLLHEMFAKDATRISRDANAAAGKYMDVFVREAIARAAVDNRGDFLEVEHLEKIAPQLLLDL